mgnify:CR=1 FL=1
MPQIVSNFWGIFNYSGFLIFNVLLFLVTSIDINFRNPWKVTSCPFKVPNQGCGTDEMIKNDQKMIKNDQKMIKNDQKWSKMIKIDQKWSKWPKMIKNVILQFHTLVHEFNSHFISKAYIHPHNRWRSKIWQAAVEQSNNKNQWMKIQFSLFFKCYNWL